MSGEGGDTDERAFPDIICDCIVSSVCIADVTLGGEGVDLWVKESLRSKEGPRGECCECGGVDGVASPDERGEALLKDDGPEVVSPFSLGF